MASQKYGLAEIATFRGRTLAREIAAALAFKAIALVLIYLAFFGPSHRVDASTDRMASVVFGHDFVEKGN